MPLPADPWLGALVIFGVRVLGISLSTVRILLMGRSRKLIVVAVAFVESLLFVIAFGSVVSQLDNLYHLMAYCLGFAVGTLVGMFIEEKIAAGYATVNVVSVKQANAVTEAIRKGGFAATQSWGWGINGPVGLIRAVVLRKDAPAIAALAQEADPQAFVTVEETRAVRHGYLRNGRS
jgi:uncharacterized protein YebE (UPF0316 family)